MRKNTQRVQKHPGFTSEPFLSYEGGITKEVRRGIRATEQLIKL